MGTLTSKVADLAGPGIGDYDELEQVLPSDYRSLLDPKETQKAIFAAKSYIEENLCRELNLMMVTVPLIMDVESGSMTRSTATAPASLSSSTSPTIARDIPSTPR